MMAWPGRSNSCGQAALRDGHADGVAEALAEGAGGGLHAGRDAVLRVARRARAELAEALQLLERQVVAGEVQHRVEQHAGVPGAEHEAVAVEPVGTGRGVPEEARPEDVGHGRGAHRGTGVTAVGLLDAVDGEGPDGVDGQLLVDGWGVAGQDRAPRGSGPARVGTRAAERGSRRVDARRVVGRKVVGEDHDTGDSPADCHRRIDSSARGSVGVGVGGCGPRILRGSPPRSCRRGSRRHACRRPLPQDLSSEPAP